MKDLRDFDYVLVGGKVKRIDHFRDAKTVIFSDGSSAQRFQLSEVPLNKDTLLKLGFIQDSKKPLVYLMDLGSLVQLQYNLSVHQLLIYTVIDKRIQIRDNVFRSVRGLARILYGEPKLTNPDDINVRFIREEINFDVLL